MRYQFAVKVTVLSALSALLLTAAALAVPAVGQTTVKVNLRQQTSAGSAALVSVPKDARVELLDNNPLINEDRLWYPAAYLGHTGYICADYVDIIALADGTETVSAEEVPVTELPASLRVGTIDAGTLRLRAKPSTGSATLVTAKQNEQVTILESTVYEGDGTTWYKVNYAGQDGYMSSKYIQVTAEAEFAAGTGTTTSSVNLRSQPSVNSTVVRKLSKDSKVEVTGIESGWFKVTYKGDSGYIHPDYLSLVVTATQTASAAGNTNSASSNAGASNDGYGKSNYYAATKTTSANDLKVATAALEDMNPTAKEREIIETALQYLGAKYVYGSNGPKTFDCSGFTTYVMKKCGITLSRTAVSQYKGTGTKITKRSEMRPGDLIFFQDKSMNSNVVTHVGIYIGNGLFVHAGSGSSGSGKCVKVSDISGGHYYKVFHSGKRVI